MLIRIFALLIALSAQMAWAQATLYAVVGANEDGGKASTLYVLNPTTGAVVRTVGAIGFSGVTGLSFHPSTGVLYAHSNQSGSDGRLITINTSTGAGTLVGATGVHMPDMAFRSDGTLFGWVEDEVEGTYYDSLATVNIATGAVTRVGTSNGDISTESVGLEFASNGTLYMKTGDILYRVNTSTGVATWVTDLAVESSTYAGMAFDSSGVAYGILRETGTLIRINLTTGALTNIGNTGLSGLSALAFGAGGAPPPPAVPVPPSLILMLTGLGGAALYGVKQKFGRR